MTTTHDHGGIGRDSNFYDWLNDVMQSSAGLPITALIVLVLSLVSEGVSAGIKRLRARPLFWIRCRELTVILHNLLSTLGYAVKIALMFILMVFFMALNPWLCASIVLGAAAGHLLFHWTSIWESEALDKEGLARSQW